MFAPAGTCAAVGMKPAIRDGPTAASRIRSCGKGRSGADNSEERVECGPSRWRAASNSCQTTAASCAGVPTGAFSFAGCGISFLGTQTVRHFCRCELASYKVPRLVEFRDDLPKSNIGKVLRKDLRQNPHPERP